MSKQSESKAKQGWVKNCPCCGTCIFFISKKYEIFSSTKSRVMDISSCDLGKFKTKPRSYCEKHTSHSKKNK